MGWYQPEMVGSTKSPNRLIVVGVFLSLGWSTYPTRNSLMINWWVSKIAPPCHLRVQESYSNRSSNLRSIFSPVVWLEDETFGIPWRDETWLLRIYTFWVRNRNLDQLVLSCQVPWVTNWVSIEKLWMQNGTKCGVFWVPPIIIGSVKNGISPKNSCLPNRVIRTISTLFLEVKFPSQKVNK